MAPGGNGEASIGGLVRWTIGPLAAVSALIFPIISFEALAISPGRLAVFACLEALFVCGTLFMISPVRFAWAGRDQPTTLGLNGMTGF